MPVIDPRALVANRVTALADFHQHVGTPRAELDLSGGVDSAVMLALLTKAIGARHVTAVYSDIDSSPESRQRARAVADAFRVRLVELDLTPLFRKLVEELSEGMWRAGYSAHDLERRIAEDPTILGSMRSCLRAPVGRGLNRMAGGGIRHGTGNECEDRWLRFYQKGGDGEVDTNPIAMLSKGEVYQLARAVEVPRAIIDALPTPDLHANGEAHNDEDELAALTGLSWTYSRIDAETGAYRSVGTIERISRFADRSEGQLFGPESPDERGWDALVSLAQNTEFSGFGPDAIRALLETARRLEAVTRHKLNPNCPPLGTRQQLVASGILTDELPPFIPVG